MKVVAIVVTYNGMKWYKKCFDSLRYSSISINTIVIDNKSTDNTTTYIKENYPEINLIESNVNLGFGKANNIGLRYALEQNADYVLLLNQDAWVTASDTIERLLRKMEKNPEYGITSPIHLAGTENKIDSNFSGYISYTSDPELISDLLIKGKVEDKVYDINFVNAAVWLISNKCVRTIGGFNPVFPHYGEDDDYINRLNIHGLKLGIYPHTFAIHDRPQQETKQTFKRKKNRYYVKHLIRLNDISVIFSKTLYWTMYSLTIDTISSFLRLNIKELYLCISTGIRIIFKIPKIIKNRKVMRTKGPSFLTANR